MLGRMHSVAPRYWCGSAVCARWDFLVTRGVFYARGDLTTAAVILCWSASALPCSIVGVFKSVIYTVTYCLCV